jgi:hypothetical protein
MTLGASSQFAFRVAALGSNAPPASSAAPTIKAVTARERNPRNMQYKVW